jgi:hypothetical protein
MIAATEDDVDEHVPHSVSGIKEKLAVTDLINQPFAFIRVSYTGTTP